MKDIEIAKKLLKEQNLAIAIVKNRELIFFSREKGIKPIYEAVTKLNENLEGSSVADRVIGKAAAQLCVYACVKELYTNLISETAIEVLKAENIIFNYKTSTLYIKNRDMTDMCPVEKLSQNISDTNVLLNKIAIFLDSIKEGV